MLKNVHMAEADSTYRTRVCRGLPPCSVAAKTSVTQPIRCTILVHRVQTPCAYTCSLVQCITAFLACGVKLWVKIFRKQTGCVSAGKPSAVNSVVLPWDVLSCVSPADGSVLLWWTLSTGLRVNTLSSLVFIYYFTSCSLLHWKVILIFNIRNVRVIWLHSAIQLNVHEHTVVQHIAGYKKLPQSVLFSCCSIRYIWP